MDIQENRSVSWYTFCLGKSPPLHMLLREESRIPFLCIVWKCAFFKETTIFVKGDNAITLVVRVKKSFVIRILLPVCSVFIMGKAEGDN